MKRVRCKYHAVIAAALFSVACLIALPAPVQAQEAGEAPDASEDARQLLEAIAEGKNVEIRLPDPEKQLPLEDLRKFTEVFSRIKAAYVEEVDDKTLLENAIKGMLGGLDPHSTYLGPKAFEELEESTTGEFGGLGIEVGMEDGFIKVIAPIDDTPAEEAGVKAGDLIIKLGEQPVKGLSLEEAVNIMRGKPGTTLTLTILRDGESAPIEIDVERAIIKVTSTKSRLIENGYGYVRLTQFQSETGQEFVDAIEKLEQANNGRLDGLVIDLRNNPGGILQAAVEAADALLEEGLIVYTEGRIQSSRLRFSAQPGDVTDGAPIVVLINGGSASASEILAGALQDQGRAVIMGTDSFGKGSVQTVIPLDDTHAIKMTTARYYTPDGRSIQAKGIKPDIEVKQAEVTEVDSEPFFTEADLSGHLDNGEGKPGGDERGDQREAAEDQGPAGADYQLRTALNLLKGLHILGKKDVEAR
ncbi:MAG: S41 family peptidase [Marinobacter sp.]|uniref:S41 family peptidase n=1 Tax=Marinobacter sp. TaxID=50741 RepID=UPI00299D9A43|nr:S41 family peptidase [Marinobacter sp.]MDX1633991.1 S41 family peptidase [Marinobacter sp.]